MYRSHFFGIYAVVLNKVNLLCALSTNKCPKFSAWHEDNSKFSVKCFLARFVNYVCETDFEGVGAEVAAHVRRLLRGR